VKRRLTHGGRVASRVLVAAVPAILVAVVALRTSGASTFVSTGVGFALTVLALVSAASARDLVERPLRTVANLLSALREEDYSFRARVGSRDDALGEVTSELNTLAEMLKNQRLGAFEATALLRTVMEEIDVAIFAIDDGGRLRLTNRAGTRLLGRSVERALGAPVGGLGLDPAFALAARGGGVLDVLYGGRPGKWEVRGGHFRLGGRPHRLLVMSDVSRALREEEREAWRRLIRVMGHEINNSLAPIKSIATSLETTLRRDPPPEDLREDLVAGLGIVGKRAEALARFTSGYSQLARLPPPRPGRFLVGDLVHRVAALHPVEVGVGLACEAMADVDQVEQAVINLVTNAMEASRSASGTIRLTWRESPPFIDIVIEDQGPGLPPSANLFVPFFTTRENGSGIGLPLSRQIAEQNGGALSLANRTDGPGACAILSVPRV
jgi:two-component system nitrogen regulation sensor histidine kinase NtrY